MLQVLDQKQDRIVKQILSQICLKPQKTDSKTLHEFLVKIANCALTIDDWIFASKNIDEKLFINHVCNGSLGLYNELKESMKNKLLEKELIKRGEHPLFVSMEDAKYFHASSHYPVFDISKQPLGTPLYLAIHKMLNKDSFKGFTLETLRAYLLTEYHINPPIHVLKKELNKINEILKKDFESEFIDCSKNQEELLLMKRVRENAAKLGLTKEQASIYASNARKNLKNDIRRNTRQIADSTLETFVGSFLEPSLLFKSSFLSKK